ncbi:TIGR04053 family radical SAM/SPASM domain-containing protein [Oceanithermus sp.]
MRPDFDRYPLLVAWEMTHACDLACKHCRASAEPDPLPGEITTEEAFRFLEEMATFKPKPILLPTGGDPLKRYDLWEILEKARELGIKIGITPAVTPLLTHEVIDRFKELDVHAMAVSLDGASPETHDTFRGVPGTFELAVDALEYARSIGLPTQINSTVTKETKSELPKLADLGRDLGISAWEVFFLVPVGRGALLQQLSAEEYEEVLRWLYQVSRTHKLNIRTTEAPHFRRVVIQERARNEGASDHALVENRRGVHMHDAYGFVFISSLGEVYPSGFLAMSAGNIKERSLLDIYQNSELFKKLRDRENLKGKCRVCEFGNVCWGSRARAWAETGDPFESETRCAYVPEAWKAQVAGD